MKIRLLKLKKNEISESKNKDLDCFFENDDTQTNLELNEYTQLLESPLKNS